MAKIQTSTQQQIPYLPNIQRLKRWAAETRAAGRGVAFTNGVFDIVHAGHVSCLHAIRAVANNYNCALVVAVNSDTSVSRLKGKHRPYVTLNYRVALLRELRCLDAVTVFYQDTPSWLIETIKPDLIAKSEEYGKAETVGADFVESYGGRVYHAPHVHGLSTSLIVEKIRKEVESARVECSAARPKR